MLEPCGPAQDRSPVATVILGLGNVLRTDDGIGVRVIQRLQSEFAFVGPVRLVDGGTRGLALIDTLIGADLIVVVDAADSGEPPGSVFCVEAAALPAEASPSFSLHELNLPQILQLAEALGRKARAYVIGIQPLDATSLGTSLSDRLEAAFEQIVDAVVGELRKLGVEVREL